MFILVSMSVHSSLSWYLFMLLMESITRTISKVTVSKFNLFRGVNWILLLRVDDGLQLYYSQSVGVLSVLSASVSSRLGTESHIRSPSSPAWEHLPQISRYLKPTKMHGLPSITERETPTHNKNSSSSTHNIFRWNRKTISLSHLVKLNRNM